MAKCVFCNQTAKEKNKEHVVPKWLIELTGSPKRVAFFGMDIAKEESRSFAWQALTAPACEDCNESFSGLENDAKSAMQSILQDGRATEEEFDTLLNWFDKVRVGTWLMSLLLDGRTKTIDPAYGIAQRLSTADRSLAIYKVTDQEDGISLSATQDPLFEYQPSAFSLRVNDTIFINASCAFMNSKFLGFPYPRRKRWTKDDSGRPTYFAEDFRCQAKPGKRGPSILSIFPETLIHQAILPKGYVAEDGSIPGRPQAVDYITRHMINDEWGERSSIFQETRDGLRPLTDIGGKSSPQPMYRSDMATRAKIEAQVYDIRKALFDESQGPSGQTQTRFHREAVKLNRIMRDHVASLDGRTAT